MASTAKAESGHHFEALKAKKNASPIPANTLGQ